MPELNATSASLDPDPLNGEAFADSPGAALSRAALLAILDGHAPLLSDLVEATAASADEVHGLIGRRLMIDETGHVVAVHGLSLVPARQHRLTIGDRQFWTPGTWRSSWTLSLASPGACTALPKWVRSVAPSVAQFDSHGFALPRTQARGTSLQRCGLSSTMRVTSGYKWRPQCGRASSTPALASLDATRTSPAMSDRRRLACTLDRRTSPLGYMCLG
jgi:hypothetical protein